MALIFRSTTIPTNAYSVKYQGKNLTKVIYKGVTVWQYVPPTTTINTPNIISVSSASLSNCNGGARERGQGIKSPNGMWLQTENCSYDNVTFVGYISAINMSGYTKVTINLTSSLTTTGSCTFGIGSYSITNGSSGHPTLTYQIAIPNNLRSRTISFTINVWTNRDTIADRYFSQAIASVVLSN